MAQDTELPGEPCSAAVGTFVLTDVRDDGEPGSRSLLMLTYGGNAEFVSAAQRGGDDYAPFSDALGQWACLSEEGENPRIRVVVLDFTFPDDGEQQMAHVDFEGTLDVDTGQLILAALLSFFPMYGDVLDGPAADADPYTTIGQKVVVAEYGSSNPKLLP
jgi:hypothetical protein